MRFLLFRLGKDRYAIEAQQVVEVLPLLAAKQIPQAPPAVRGAFDFRGQPVPLIDLTQLALGHPVREHLSTRIVLVRHPDGRGGQRLLGLLAEHVTETMRRDPASFSSSGVENTLTTLDLRKMDVIGYNRTVPEPQMLVLGGLALALRRRRGQ